MLILNYSFVVITCSFCVLIIISIQSSGWYLWAAEAIVSPVTCCSVCAIQRQPIAGLAAGPPKPRWSWDSALIWVTNKDAIKHWLQSALFECPQSTRLISDKCAFIYYSPLNYCCFRARHIPCLKLNKKPPIPLLLQTCHFLVVAGRIDGRRMDAQGFLEADR